MEFCSIRVVDDQVRWCGSGLIMIEILTVWSVNIYMVVFTGIIVSSSEDISESEPVQLGRTMVLERVRQMVARIRRSRAHIIDSDSEV